MKYLILLVALLPSLAFAAATDAQCHLRAVIVFSLAVDRDVGFPINVAPSVMRGLTKTANSPGVTKFIAAHGADVIAIIYSHPDVQPQVWFGYELGMCEGINPASPGTIFPAPTNTTSAETNAPAEMPPDHYYVYAEKDGTYGYTRPLSQEDINSGTAENELVLIRYLGEQNGIYKAITTNPDGSEGLISCSKPCQFITVQTIDNGQVINKEVIPAADTLGQAIMTDAINGKLKVYKHGQ